MTITDDKDINYLFSILAPLTDNPQDIKITRSLDQMGVLLSVQLHPEDLGKVIGRSGDTSRAIRHLLRQFGMAFKTRISIKIVTP